MLATQQVDIRILGVGSPFGADTFGWEVVDFLNENHADDLEGIHIEKLDRPGLSLIKKIQPASMAIIIDAVQAQSDGELVFENVDHWLSGEVQMSSHDVGVENSLALASALGDLPSQCYICGMTISEMVNKQLPAAWLKQAAERILKAVKTALPAT